MRNLFSELLLALIKTFKIECFAALNAIITAVSSFSGALIIDMKKIIYSVLILSAFLSAYSCSSNIVGQLPLNIPVECSDPNAVTFDDGDFSFASVINDDSESACGEISVVEVVGNKMLKFTDDMTIPLDGKVQKICINAVKLIGAEKLPEVRSIEFDVYADAISDGYINQDGENIIAPGTISCGGGTVVSLTDKNGKGKWYDFEGFEGGEYNLSMSGAVHGKFKFLLAESGFCWSEKMDDANFLIMRWGSENQSDLYIDNIVFFDENGVSIPLDKK